MYNLLDHPELQKPKNNKAVKISYQWTAVHGMTLTPVDELNLEDGLAGTMMDKIVDYMQREKARNEVLTHDQTNIWQRSHEVFTNVTKKVTAGIAFHAGESELGVEVLKVVREQHNKKRDEELVAKERKKHEKLLQLKEKVDTIQAKGNDPEKWSVKDLKDLCNWFKCEGDNPIPTTRPALLKWYQLTCTCNEEEHWQQAFGEVIVPEEDAHAPGDHKEVWHHCWHDLQSGAKKISDFFWAAGEPMSAVIY